MLHLRDDYNVIQDVSALLAAGVLQFGPNATPEDRARFARGHHTSIGDDEPVFLLRARDVAAAPAVAFWAQRAALHEADPQMIDLVRNRFAVEMADWARQNGGKVPDTPVGALPLPPPVPLPPDVPVPEGPPIVIDSAPPSPPVDPPEPPPVDDPPRPTPAPPGPPVDPPSPPGPPNPPSGPPRPPVAPPGKGPVQRPFQSPARPTQPEGGQP